MVGNDGTIHVSSELRTKNKEFNTFASKKKKKNSGGLFLQLGGFGL